MKKTAFLAAALAAVAVESNAGTFAIPTVSSGEYTLGDAADSAAVKKLYGIGFYANVASADAGTDLTVSSETLNFNVHFADSSAGTYTANVGLLFPLDKSWKNHNLAGDTVFSSMDITLSGDTPSGGYEISFSSPSKDGTCELGGWRPIATESDNGTYHLTASSFKRPSTWKCTDDSVTLTTTLSALQTVQVAPKTTYENSGKTPTTTSGTYHVSGLVINYTTSSGISGSKSLMGTANLVANYSKGLVLSYALENASSAKIDVVRLDGSKVASFEGAAKATNQAFAVNLARGTYFVIVKGGSSNFVAPVAVMR